MITLSPDDRQMVLAAVEQRIQWLRTRAGEFDERGKSYEAGAVRGSLERYEKLSAKLWHQFMEHPPTRVSNG